MNRRQVIQHILAGGRRHSTYLLAASGTAVTAVCAGNGILHAAHNAGRYVQCQFRVRVVYISGMVAVLVNQEAYLQQVMGPATY